MCKIIVSKIVLTIMILTCTAAYAMTKAEKGGEQGIIIIEGKVTDINGNIITITKNNGGVNIFEVASTVGIIKGAAVICEEDCGSQIKIGRNIIKVRKILK